MSAAVFIGGGRITAALAAGLRRSKFQGHIAVFDRHPEKLRRLEKQFGVEPFRNARHAAEQAATSGRSDLGGLLLVAVRPGGVLPLLAEIGPLPRRTLAVSLAAGVPLRLLRRALGPHVEWARAMPSPAARAGLGLTALAFDRRMRSDGRRRVRDFFSRVGPVIEIPERQFNAFTVAYSTSQGCAALLARMRAGQRLGLDRKTAFLAAAHSLADGIRALRGPDDLKAALSETATPGGIAAQLLETMRSAGYQPLVERAFRAGLARAQNVAKR